MQLTYNLPKVQLFKAVLPVLIILHHYSIEYGFPPFLYAIGLPVVACFFTMSGYGLMTSYLSKGDRYLDGFLQRSTVKLFGPYLLALLVFLPFELYLQKSTLPRYFSDVPFIHWLKYSWFVFVLWGGYFFFYLIFRLKILTFNKVVLYAVPTVAYYVIMLVVLDGHSSVLFRTSYAIYLGMLWKYNESRLLSVLQRRFVLPVALTLSAVCFFITLQQESLLWNPLFTVTTFVCLAYALPITRENRVIKFLSRISYEMYLWQGLCMILVLDYMGIERLTRAIPLVICLDVLVSIAARKVFRQL